MGIFDAAAAAALRGETIIVETLVSFHFASRTVRIHGGFGPIALGGVVWDGTGGLIRISDIETAVGGIAPLVSFTLSGVGAEASSDFHNQASEVQGRICEVQLQLFGEDLAPLGPLYTVLRNRMSRLTHSAENADRWTLELETEGPFSRRGLPPFGNLTDRDQQRRYPGDRGLFNVQAMINRRRPWNPTIPD